MDPGRTQYMSEVKLLGLMGRTDGFMSSFEQRLSTLGWKLHDMSYFSRIFRCIFGITSCGNMAE